MPKSRMTWESGKSRWRKMYKGQLYTSSNCQKSDRQAEQKAWSEFVRFRAKIDQQEESDKQFQEDYRLAVTLRTAMLKLVDSEVEAQKIDGSHDDSIVTQLASGLTHQKGAETPIEFPSEDSLETNEDGMIDVLSGFKAPNREKGQNSNLAKFLSQRLETCESGDDIETDQADSKERTIQHEKESELVRYVFMSEDERRKIKTDSLTKWAQQLKSELKELDDGFKQKNPPKLNGKNTLSVNPLLSQPLQVIQRWADRLGEIEKTERLNGSFDLSETVKGNIDQYLKRQKVKVDSGEICISTYRTIKQRIEYFQLYAGKKPIGDLNERLMSAYQESLQMKVQQEESSPQHAKNLLNAAKTFATFVWEEGILENQIRNLKKLKIHVPDPIIQTLDNDTLNTLVNESSERTRLYLLLMMNTGMTQQDISDLSQTEVDWKNGYIERKRSKTSNQRNVPMVKFLLWDKTFRLLKKHRSKDPERVLLSENSTELKRMTIKENGQVSTVDVIQLAFRRVKNKTKIKGCLKDIRSTVASKFDEQSEFSRYAQYFLGQAPKTVADRHYVKPDQNRFDNAVIWLGEQFDQKTERKLSKSNIK